MLQNIRLSKSQKFLCVLFLVQPWLNGCAGSPGEPAGILSSPNLIDALSQTSKPSIQQQAVEQMTETTPTKQYAKYFDTLNFVGDPIETYTIVGRLVHKCWLNPAAPLLAGQVFYAETKRGQFPKATLSLHRKGELGRKGRITFAIDMKGNQSSTYVTSVNYKIAPPIAQFMYQDIDRWSDKDLSCRAVPEYAAELQAPKPVKLPEGTVPLPRKAPRGSH